MRIQHSVRSDSANGRLSDLDAFIRRAMRRILSPQGIISIIVLVVLAYVILMPVAFMIHDSLTFSIDDLRLVPGATEGAFTLRHWIRTFTSKPRFLGPLKNTLVVSAGTMVLAIIIGGFFAWLITLTDVPFKGLLELLCMLPYMLPSWAFSMAWVQILQHRGVGRPTGFLAYLTGWNAPEWLVFGPLPIIINCAVHYSPFAYLTLSAALSGIDSQVEEAADILGASRFTIMRKITFPLVTPALLSAAILVFSRVMGTFATVSVLGVPARYQVLSTQVYSLTRFGRMSEASVVAIALIALCAIIVYVNNKVMGTRKDYAVIGGKGTKKRLFSLGKYRKLAGVLSIVFLSLVVLLPLFLLAYSSVMLNEGDWSLNNLSLHWWVGKPSPHLAHGEPGILVNPTVLRSTWNTIRVSVITALLCGVFGLLIGYVVVRMKRHPIATAIDAIAFIPVVIPSIAFGAVYLSIFAQPRPFIPMLYGSFVLLVMVAFAKRVPYTTRTGVSAMHQISAELEEAAYLHGASLWRRIVSILFPLARPGFIAGVFLVVTTTMREMSLFVLLMSPGNRVLAGQTFVYNEIGASQLSNALMTFIMILSLTLAGIVKLWENRASKTQVTVEK